MPAGEARSLGSLRWPEIEALGRSAVLAVPVGSLEQHGPHLPLDTDTRVAVALARKLAERNPRVLVAPAVSYGASGEHADFPGTLSLGQPVVTSLVVELVRSARTSFAGVVIVSGHGGNADALARAAARSRFEGDRVLVWSPAVPEGDAHAGRTETSLLLAIDPSAVDVGAARAGETAPLSSVLPELRRAGVRAVSPNGVLGDPAGASADEGRRLLAALADDLVGQVARWWPAAGEMAR